jgi:hypothetical protein
VQALNIEPEETDWNLLANAVAGVLDHQSEESTDIRWFKLALTIISGHLNALVGLYQALGGGWEPAPAEPHSIPASR